MVEGFHHCGTYPPHDEWLMHAEQFLREFPAALATAAQHCSTRSGSPASCSSIVLLLGARVESLFGGCAEGLGPRVSDVYKDLHVPRRSVVDMDGIMDAAAVVTGVVHAVCRLGRPLALLSDLSRHHSAVCVDHRGFEPSGGIDVAHMLLFASILSPEHLL